MKEFYVVTHTFKSTLCGTVEKGTILELCEDNYLYNGDTRVTFKGSFNCVINCGRHNINKRIK